MQAAELNNTKVFYNEKPINDIVDASNKTAEQCKRTLCQCCGVYNSAAQFVFHLPATHIAISICCLTVAQIVWCDQETFAVFLGYIKLMMVIFEDAQMPNRIK